MPEPPVVAPTPEQRLDRLEARLADLDDARARIAQLEQRLADQERRPPVAPAPRWDPTVPRHAPLRRPTDQGGGRALHRDIDGLGVRQVDTDYL